MEQIVECKIEKQILEGTKVADKSYSFNNDHDETKPAQYWFQKSDEGEILFIVFYTQACRWSRCLGCNLPSKMSQSYVDFRAIIKQVDTLLAIPEIMEKAPTLKKVIVSNNGSVLDQDTFSSTALMYFIAMLNLHFPMVQKLTLESRPEYVDIEELEFLFRAINERSVKTTFELAIGFEVFDEKLRNDFFFKGLTLEGFEKLCKKMGQYGFDLKCYFMQKPVPGMTDEEAVEDICKALDYLDSMARKYNLPINMHLNPTYVAYGTPLEDRFREGVYTPPLLKDVAKAVLCSEGKEVSIFLGLSDEGLACEGGSFIREGDEPLLNALEEFNTTRDFDTLREFLN